jgi:hypothetical protein
MCMCMCRVVCLYAALPPCSVFVCGVSIAALPLAFRALAQSHDLLAFGQNG